MTLPEGGQILKFLKFACTSL